MHSFGANAAIKGELASPAQRLFVVRFLMALLCTYTSGNQDLKVA
jgi:hypothetical protein